MRASAAVLVALMLVGCKGEVGTQGAEPLRPAPPVVAAPAPEPKPTPPVPSAPPAPTRTKAAFSVAEFKGDTIAQCITTTTSLVEKRDEDGGPAWLSAGQASLMLYDEVVTSNEGGRGVLNSGVNINDMLDGSLVDKTIAAQFAKPGVQPFSPEKLDEFRRGMSKEMLKVLSAATWPLKADVKRVQAGELLKVENCAISGKPPLGRCVLEGSGPGDSWSVEQVYFLAADVTDSDAALKKCARISGKWSAVDRNDPDVRMEMLHQHTRAAQEQLEKLRQSAGGQ